MSRYLTSFERHATRHSRPLTVVGLRYIKHAVKVELELELELDGGVNDAMIKRMDMKMTTRGQVTIPSALRRKLGIVPGTHIAIEVDEDERRIILTPITREYVHSLRGKYKGKGLLKALVAERKREREL